MLRLRDEQRPRVRAWAASSVAAVCYALLGATAQGCALDDRTLQPVSGSGAGADSGNGGAPVGLEEPPAVELPVCTYARNQVEPGCETMVSNAGFETNIDGWLAEPLAITVGWDRSDATGDEASGSIAVVNSMHGRNDGFAPGGGRQCLPAEPGTVYDMAGDVFIPDGQGAGFGEGPFIGRAGLSILFWPNADCSNKDRSLNPSYQTNLVEGVEAWTRVSGSAVAPDGAASMSMRVLTIKPFYEYSFKALFDNVLLRKRPSMP